MAIQRPRGGMDLGGTKIQAAIVDPGGKVLGEARHPTPTTGGPADVARAMEDALREAAAAAGVKPEELEGVGVGSPGGVDAKAGVVSGARNLPGWEGGFRLGDALAKALGTEVRVGNDVHVAVEAECRLGAGRPYGSLLGVWWGTGVGGGIVLDGKPWSGRGAAGEIGHTVVKRNGARCPCGRRGCLEAYAGRAAMEAKARREREKGVETGLFEIMEKHGKDRLTSSVWDHALHEHDPLAESLIRRAVRYLGTGIASAVNLLDVEAVLLGGGLGSRLGDRYLDDLGKEMRKHLFVPGNPPRLELASLGDLDGAIGASLLFSR
ncbi:MAG TPA: ROK family protein [Solirubrobacterales bacterium]|nr:ROK family protein [Solirubrobacterales bacterium]